MLSVWSFSYMTLSCGSALAQSCSSRLTNAVVVVGVLKARVADAVVGAQCVLARPISTRLTLTFIHI